MRWAANCQIDVLFLLETRNKFDSSLAILSQNFSDWEACCNYNHAANGRIWVLWRRCMDCSVVSVFDQCISVRCAIGGNTFILIAVYGLNEGNGRRQLWSQLNSLECTVGDLPWLIGGDFNIILNVEESSVYVSSSTLVDSSEFQNCVDNLGIFDHPYNGPCFTWSNKQQDTYLARKLDRVMINPRWIDVFPDSAVEFQAPGDSDHCPAFVWLHKAAPSARPKPFKFFNFWALHPGFLNIVRDSWQQPMAGNPAQVLFQKLKRLNSIENELQVERELKNLEEAELLFYKQKAKANWIKEGDQGTKFFHSVVASRRKSNTIRVLYDQAGNRLDSFDGISAEVIKFFQNQLGLVDDNVLGSTVSTIRGLLNFSLPTGADGELYCFDISFILPAFNATAVVLVPKVPNPSLVKDFRPISYCTVIYKTITRILVRRLSTVFPSMVLKNQTAFVKVVVLTALGLPARFISWISACFTKPSYSIVINGSLVGYFRGDRGVRQGDPLSPYLFVLSMNVLSNLLNLAALKGIFNYHPKCKRIGLTHLCFADDLLIFCEPSVDSISGVKAVLEVFNLMSGLKLNINKSEIFVAGLTAAQCTAISEGTGFKLGKLPVRYLGIPLVTKKLMERDCLSLIDKIRARLTLWENKHLSFAGRLQLVRSVLFSLTNYWCRQVMLPRGVIKKVEQLCSRYFWKGADLSARVSWRKICLPKSEGGLGVIDIQGWNRACSVRLIRNLLADEGSLWVAWTRSYVIKNANFWHMVPPTDASWNFKKLLKMRHSVNHLFVNRDCALSTRQIWEDLRIVAPKVAWHHLVWFSGRIPKHNIILWMAILDRLPTRVRLMRMGLVIENDRCLFCDLVPETRNHIFFECDYAKSLWKAILLLCGVNRRVSHWEGELSWAAHFLKGKSLLTRVFKLPLTSYVYVIWRERNNRLYGGLLRLMSDILLSIKTDIQIRLDGWPINRSDSRNIALCMDDVLMGWYELLWIGRLLLLMQLVHGWGKLGHYAVCKIAEGHLTEDATATVKQLLPDSAKGELASVCSWPDHIKYYYNWQWTTSLHYVDTPNFKCNYKYIRDCYDSAGHKNNCVTGAILNYTKQLLTSYQRYNPMLKYNLTESLLFLAHYMADVHQPLHVGFTGDLGGTSIKVRWYRRKTTLHHVWDTMIIDTAVKTFYGSNLLIFPGDDAWTNEKSSWKYCIHNNTVCPNMKVYASESVRLACKYAYKNATPGSTLEDDYFLSRLPVVEKGLAQGGIRLASVLNRLFNFRVKMGRSSR
ncbi:uncharacterized protein LOC120135683 [Hibiscus syriacus]|uniref:uncharacterized protein LOC120135683 n=1 Tax=Hibiscus syriacus TaxID=106335 RepID=UPI0019217251|nr:uncharacterized protein LOC120135683 [Hibiscus syriacus]